jgi:inhibitor of KinA
MQTSPHLVPLGDQAVLAYLANEQAACRLAGAIRNHHASWLVDIVQAYTTVAVYFDLERTHFTEAARSVRDLAAQSEEVPATAEGRLHLVPCCYELGLDLERVAAHTGLTAQEVVRRHAGSTYSVFAIGFCPGFPYLGYLPDELCGVPRLPAPRLRVEAGSVGLTGRQTGVYSEARPGGWNIVGRTPLELVHVADGYFPLGTGDRIRFVPVDCAEYQERLGERLCN